MKTIKQYLWITGLLLCAPAAFGGEASRSAQPAVANTRTNTEVAPPPLPVFDLDFKGGTPAELVAAIEKASGRPLNAIIPDEFANIQLPALRMKGVNVPQLFAAIEQASAKTVTYITGSTTDSIGHRNAQYQQTVTSMGFKTPGNSVWPDSIWSFYNRGVTKPPVLPEDEQVEKLCRFWQVGGYLDAGYTIDDITTAIETSWKMLGEKTPPKMNFHKDTRLLIAVGAPDKLKLIDDVLRELRGIRKKGSNLPAAAEDVKTGTSQSTQ
jgi:hypothetical protein